MTHAFVTSDRAAARLRRRLARAAGGHARTFPTGGERRAAVLHLAVGAFDRRANGETVR